MTLERISAFITYCIAVVLAWLGDLSIKDASTLGGLMIGVLMLAINLVVYPPGTTCNSFNRDNHCSWCFCTTAKCS